MKIFKPKNPQIQKSPNNSPSLSLHLHFHLQQIAALALFGVQFSAFSSFYKWLAVSAFCLYLLTSFSSFLLQSSNLNHTFFFVGIVDLPPLKKELREVGVLNFGGLQMGIFWCDYWNEFFVFCFLFLFIFFVF